MTIINQLLKRLGFHPAKPYGVVPAVVLSPGAIKLIEAGVAALLAGIAAEEAEKIISEKKEYVPLFAPITPREATDEEAQIIARDVYHSLNTEKIDKEIADIAFKEGAKNEEDVKKITEEVLNSFELESLIEDAIRARASSGPEDRKRKWEEVFAGLGVAGIAKKTMDKIKAATFWVFMAEETVQIITFTQMNVANATESIIWTGNDLVDDARFALSNGDKAYAKECMTALLRVITELDVLSKQHGDFGKAAELAHDKFVAEYNNLVDWYNSM